MNNSVLRLLPKDVLVEIVIPEVQEDLKKQNEILEAKISLFDAMLNESRLVIDCLADGGKHYCMTRDCTGETVNLCSSCQFGYCNACFVRFNEVSSGIKHCVFCNRMEAVQKAQLKNELKMKYLTKD